MAARRTEVIGMDTLPLGLSGSNGVSHPEVASEEVWDLNALRLSQNFDEVGGVPTLMTVEIRKPKRQEFVRVHPDPDWQIPAGLLQVEETREWYVLTADIQQRLLDEVIPVDLVTAINRAGQIFLWPLKRGKGGRSNSNSWITTARAGAQLAQTYWVRIVSSSELSGYQAIRAVGDLADPVWPEDVTFHDIFRLGTKGLVISSWDHPVLERMRGKN